MIAGSMAERIAFLIITITLSEDYVRIVISCWSMFFKNRCFSVQNKALLEAKLQKQNEELVLMCFLLLPALSRRLNTINYTCTTVAQHLLR
jgi:hypothetical protein